MAESRLFRETIREGGGTEVTSPPFPGGWKTKCINGKNPIQEVYI